MVLFFDVLWSVTRRVMRNEAVTCFFRDENAAANYGKYNNGTNLSPDKHREEGVANGTLGSPRPEKQQITDSVKGTRFDKDGDDCLVQLEGSDKGSHHSPNIPAV